MMTYLSFLLHYCPRPLLVLWLIAHLLFWLAVFLYSSMALTQFEAWWQMVKVTFWAGLATYPFVTVAAWAARGRR
jgi:hypothetical protein